MFKRRNAPPRAVKPGLYNTINWWLDEQIDRFILYPLDRFWAYIMKWPLESILSFFVLVLIGLAVFVIGVKTDNFRVMELGIGYFITIMFLMAAAILRAIYKILEFITRRK